jgi:hypothetical protein
MPIVSRSRERTDALGLRRRSRHGQRSDINLPAAVFRQTGEDHKGAMVEFQQYFAAGQHQYGIAKRTRQGRCSPSRRPDTNVSRGSSPTTTHPTRWTASISTSTSRRARRTCRRSSRGFRPRGVRMSRCARSRTRTCASPLGPGPCASVDPHGRDRFDRRRVGRRTGQRTRMLSVSGTPRRIVARKSSARAGAATSPSRSGGSAQNSFQLGQKSPQPPS